MTDTNIPEYSKEQVEAAKAGLERCMKYSWGPYAFPHEEVRTVLSVLAEAQAAITELREPNTRELSQFRDLLEKNAALRSRLEIAERDERERCAQFVAGFPTSDASCAMLRDRIAHSLRHWPAHSTTPTQGGVNGT